LVVELFLQRYSVVEQMQLVKLRINLQREILMQQKLPLLV
jgi:hypothetical protein